MPPISAADGPVAVTGASGYIGSWVVKNLAENGYVVRACVRDASREDRTAHLLAINQSATGEVQLFSADLMNEYDYDPIFEGCSAVFHVAANFGTDPRWAAATDVVGRLSPIDAAAAKVLGTEAQKPTTSYDQGVYDSLVVATQRVLRAIERTGETVKRLVYTSSFAAVSGPRPDGHIITEADWAGAGPYISEANMMKKHKGHWTAEDNAYGKGKTDCEIMIYDWGPQHGVECMSSCPSVVLGPLLAAPHDMTWQHRLGDMFAGRYCLDILWNVTDVRDIGETQRLMAESPVAKNGSRYMNCAPSASAADGFSIGELCSTEVVDIMRARFPEYVNQICKAPAHPPGQSGWGRKRKGAWSSLAERELGLKIHDPTETITDTLHSMLKLELIGKRATIAELRELYNVSEMDECEEEMQWILDEIKRRADAGDSHALSAVSAARL